MAMCMALVRCDQRRALQIVCDSYPISVQLEMVVASHKFGHRRECKDGCIH